MKALSEYRFLGFIVETTTDELLAYDPSIYDKVRVFETKTCTDQSPKHLSGTGFRYSGIGVRDYIMY